MPRPACGTCKLARSISLGSRFVTVHAPGLHGGCGLPTPDISPSSRCRSSSSERDKGTLRCSCGYGAQQEIEGGCLTKFWVTAPMWPCLAADHASWCGMTFQRPPTPPFERCNISNKFKHSNEYMSVAQTVASDGPLGRTCPDPPLRLRAQVRLMLPTDVLPCALG